MEGPDYLFVKKLDNTLPDLARKSTFAAGYDLPLRNDENIPPHSQQMLATGIAVAPSRIDRMVRLTGRSSTFIRHKLLVVDGVIDVDPLDSNSFLLSNETLSVTPQSNRHFPSSKIMQEDKYLTHLTCPLQINGTTYSQMHQSLYLPASMLNGHSQYSITIREGQQPPPS